MPEAARLGDITAHGGFIAAPGCADVLINTLLAARVGDQHLCAVVEAGKPHVGGPIVSGARDVKIGAQFAARAIDTAICHGALDVIAGGSPDVLIGGVTLTFHPSQHGGNSLVAVDPETGTVFVESFLEYRGPGASQAYADAAKKSIEDTWNGSLRKDGKTYDVQVNVHTAVNPDGPPTPGYDPVIVSPATTRADQSLFGNGDGHQNPTNAAPRSRVAAHEFGHTLGLPDEYHDTPTGSVPNDPTKRQNIMSQTWPDADGTMPHPHQDHYQKILGNYGW
jgi:uncharacterized Zn-binding protein involved in type VI secretion